MVLPRGEYVWVYATRDEQTNTKLTLYIYCRMQQVQSINLMCVPSRHWHISSWRLTEAIITLHASQRKRTILANTHNIPYPSGIQSLLWRRYLKTTPFTTNCTMNSSTNTHSCFNGHFQTCRLLNVHKNQLGQAETLLQPQLHSFYGQDNLGKPARVR